MKLNGEKINGPNEVIVVIPRSDKDLIFKAKAVLDFDEFNKLCPEPVPPSILKKGFSQPTPDLKDKKYVEEYRKYSTQRFGFLILKSLEATENLEWETVDMNEPSTWENYQTELREAGFTEIEIGRLVGAALEANSLDDSKIEEARQRFFARQGA